MNQIPNIEETHNTREIEEIVEQFEKRMPLITSHGLLLEARLTPTSYLKMKEWLRTTLHQQLQKERKEERERIATELDRYAHESHSATINIKHLMEKLVDHSELDQDKK